MTTSVDLSSASGLHLLASEHFVVLDEGTVWRVPWELLILGPFTSCGLRDGQAMRRITAAAMLRSAVRHAWGPSQPLEPSDYELMYTLQSDITLLDAARTVIDVGWEQAVIDDNEPRLITSRTLLRAMLSGSDPSSQFATPG